MEQQLKHKYGTIRVDWKKHMGSSWAEQPEIKNFLDSSYMQHLLYFIYMRGRETTVYPDKKDVFRAFNLCSERALKVVIIGQDPYHDGSATGLAFGNNVEDKKSPSLRRILDVIDDDFGNISFDIDPSLVHLASQGVLLLNTALTVEKGKANSHKKPWDHFTKFIIKWIAKYKPGTVFLLWGKQAQSYKVIDKIDIEDTCYVIEAEHPAAGVYAGRKKWKHNDCFNKTNEILKKIGESTIIW